MRTYKLLLVPQTMILALVGCFKSAGVSRYIKVVQGRDDDKPIQNHRPRVIDALGDEVIKQYIYLCNIHLCVVYVCSLNLRSFLTAENH